MFHPSFSEISKANLRSFLPKAASIGINKRFGIRFSNRSSARHNIARKMHSFSREGLPSTFYRVYSGNRRHEETSEESLAAPKNLECLLLKV